MLRGHRGGPGRHPCGVALAVLIGGDLGPAAERGEGAADAEPYDPG
ncbi:hypothetical protein [Microtetraspora malaysiensis]